MSPKSEHITPVLKTLHWLPVLLRIRFKLLLLTYGAVNNCAPAYLSDLIHPYKQNRSLRSESHHYLQLPRSKLKSAGDRSFSVAAPTEWNKLPLSLRQADSLSSLNLNSKRIYLNHIFSK